MATTQSTLTFNPNGYDSSNSSYSSISTSNPISNAYTPATSTTYAYITTNTGSGAVTKIALTFDLSSIPSDATIDSVSCNVKGGMSTTTTSRMASAVAQLYNGTTAMGSSASILVSNTSAASTALSSCGTWTRSTLDNLELIFTATRGTSRTTTAYYMYVYGADLSITYSVTTKETYTVTTTITGGTVTSTNPDTITEGENATITFTKTTDTDVLKSMTVNGTEVTPTWVDEQPGGTATITPSTNTDEYTTDSNGIAAVCDGDSSTYYWTQQTQAVGDYILLTLSKSVYLNGVSTVCTKSSTDYFKSNCELQISTNGTDWTTVGTCSDSSSQSFTNINKYCQYVRFYITTASNSWWCVNEITLDYDTTDIPAHYEYTISDVSENQTVAIVFGTNGPTLYVKTDSTTWKAVSKIYKKESTGWVEITVSDLQTLAEGKKFAKLELPETAIGNITTSTNAINLTADTITSDTYTLYYEDADGNKLTGWDAIGTITKS